MQHFRVKIFATKGAQGDLHHAIAVFHRWIQEKKVPGLLIDVSDYLHVPNGPGVILVGHDAIYGLDQEKGRLGLLYNRRTVLDGPDSARLRHSLDSARAAAALLESEPEFAGKLAFSGSELEVSVNDRALAPNNDETWRAFEPAFREVFGPGWTFARVGEPRELLRISVKRT